MITSPLENGKQLVVNSNWDSGKHLGISIGQVNEDDWSEYKGLEKLLSKEQIKGLEAIITVAVESYLKENTL